MQERRQHQRIAMCAQVTCIVDTRTMRGVSRNLSRAGIRLEGADLKIADSVQLTFRLDSHAIVDAKALWFGHPNGDTESASPRWAIKANCRFAVS